MLVGLLESAVKPDRVANGVCTGQPPDPVELYNYNVEVFMCISGLVVKYTVYM